MQNLLAKIRRRETPFYNKLYLLLKATQGVNVPVVRPLHRFLYAERMLRHSVWHVLVQNLYFNPLFKSQCQSCGKNLKIFGGLPLLVGDIRLHLGDDCILHGSTTIVGAKVFEAPTLRVGNNTHLGHQLGITVGADVTIGNDVLIAGGVNILAYPGHPSDPAQRHGVAPKESSRPIIIEDNVWIGTRAVIMKGVTIGKNSIIAPASVVTMKVPPDSIALGNPARIFPLFT
jgi:acetyltransferase-like isoleucine patch superfamily enzyme